MDIVASVEFEPRTVDKVERLLDLLEEMERHPKLKGKLALHGGTAINLFLLDLPRLSVDIDLSYIGEISRDAMLLERSAIESGIEVVARSLGYALEPSNGGHAGRTFLLRYHGDWGVDHVKIDCIYMNRSPVLPLVMRETSMRKGVQVRTFSDAELIGGKVKAFFDRVKVRDLYDVSNLKTVCENFTGDERKIIHKVIIYYASLSACFPYGFTGRQKRFANRLSELEEQLYPMLKLSALKPTLDSLIQDACAFISNWVEPQTDEEHEYLERFSQCDYAPEILFADSQMASAAAVNPEALWKLQNIRKMVN